MTSPTPDLTPREAQLAADYHADASVELVAAVYAQAFLGAAQKAGQLDAAADELDALISGMLDPFPRFEALLGSLLVGDEQRAGMLDRVLAGRVSPLLLNFLKVVSRHGRLGALRTIHREARRLRDEMQDRVRVRLTSATEIDGELLERVTGQLRAVLGGEPRVQQVVQPDLIGGVIVRIGDTVYDASIATQLETLRQQMIDRSVHEIQSRRDRFRHPARD